MPGPTELIAFRWVVSAASLGQPERVSGQKIREIVTFLADLGVPKNVEQPRRAFEAASVEYPYGEAHPAAGAWSRARSGA